MMRAAIYSRKSTAQDGVDDTDLSVQRQEDSARAFAAAKGWTVLDGHVYADKGISGAAAPATLREKARMLAAIMAVGGPPFEVLITQAPDRLSRRDGDESFAELKAIARAGVEIWFYADGSRFTFGDFASNTLGFLRGEFAAEYRRAIAVKTSEAMRRKFQRGHVVGGRTFGYDNCCSACARLLPSGAERCCKDGHTVRRINPAEAAVVREIHERSARGEGLTRITKALNAAGAVTPRAQQGRPHAWATSSVRAVLHRTAYSSDDVYGKTKKRDVFGAVHQTPRPASEWQHRTDPSLRIISDELWSRAHDRLAERQRKHTGGRGRQRDLDSHYLLSGFARCGTCNGGLAHHSRQHGSQRARTSYYGCTSY